MVVEKDNNGHHLVLKELKTLLRKMDVWGTESDSEDEDDNTAFLKIDENDRTRYFNQILQSIDFSG